MLALLPLFAGFKIAKMSIKLVKGGKMAKSGFKAYQGAKKSKRPVATSNYTMMLIVQAY